MGGLAAWRQDPWSDDVTHYCRWAAERRVAAVLRLLPAHLPFCCAAGRVMQFVSWKGFAPVGPELPEPVWVR